MTTRTPRRTQAPEVRRRQILNAARGRFRDVGFQGAAMAEIAADAGVSVGLIYRFFPSKEALIEGIVREDTQAQLTQLTAVLDRHPEDLTAAMTAVTDAFVDAMADRDRTALMVEIAAETIRNPALQVFASGRGEEARALLRDRLGALKPAGWSMDDMEARFQLLGALAQGLSIQAAMRGGAPDVQLRQALGQTVRLLFSSGGEP